MLILEGVSQKMSGLGLENVAKTQILHQYIYPSG